MRSTASHSQTRAIPSTADVHLFRSSAKHILPSSDCFSWAFFVIATRKATRKVAGCRDAFPHGFIGCCLKVRTQSCPSCPWHSNALLSGPSLLASPIIAILQLRKLGPAEMKCFVWYTMIKVTFPFPQSVSVRSQGPSSLGLLLLEQKCWDKVNGNPQQNLKAVRKWIPRGHMCNSHPWHLLSLMEVECEGLWRLPWV